MSLAQKTSESPRDQDQEVDVWWGAYSGWTLIPSLLVCFILTGLFSWLAWLMLPRGRVQLGVFTLVGLVWLVESLQYALRVFGKNYRLTTRRLFKDKGVLWRKTSMVDLTKVTQIYVKRNRLERWLGVGRIYIRAPEVQRRLIVLNGITAPEGIAEQIWQTCRKAQEKLARHQEEMQKRPAS
jgi:membrane protein YdbS with pleckstrin-like domain